MDSHVQHHQKRPQSYHLKHLHLAGHQLRYSDEAYLIAFEAQGSLEKIDAPQARKSSQLIRELRIHFTRVQYALLKRLLEFPGEIVPFEELIELVLSASFPKPTHPFRALANHIYRLRKILPKFVVIYCESGNGYAVMLLPAETPHLPTGGRENP